MPPRYRGSRSAYRDWADDNVDKQYSPSHHANKLNIPVLLIHGLQDTNTSPLNSVDFLQKSLEAEKDGYVSSLYIRNMGHEFAKESWSAVLKFMESIRWLKANHNNRKIQYHSNARGNSYSLGRQIEMLTYNMHPDSSDPVHQFMRRTAQAFAAARAAGQKFRLNENYTDAQGNIDPSFLYFRRFLWKDYQKAYAYLHFTRLLPNVQISEYRDLAKALNRLSPQDRLRVDQAVEGYMPNIDTGADNQNLNIYNPVDYYNEPLKPENELVVLSDQGINEFLFKSLRFNMTEEYLRKAADVREDKWGNAWLRS